MAQPSRLEQNLGFRSALSAIGPDSLEEVVQMAWQMIIGEWFPGQSGYKWAFKAPVLDNENAPDAVVFQIVAVRPDPSKPNDFIETPILLVECKRPSRDTPDGWYTTLRDQVSDDAEAIGNPSKKIFIAVGIGKKVRFYRYDGWQTEQQQMIQLHQGEIDMGSPGGLAEVGGMMDHIKAHGWQWARSS